MNIHSIRLGPATNSSSSHSLIFMDNPPADTCRGTQEFGWNRFVASSPQSKAAYAAQTLKGALCRHVPSDVAELIAREWLGEPCKPDGYIDHQSEYVIPCDRDDFPSREFAREFAAFLQRDGLVVLGGNDNDGPEHPVAAFRLDLPRDTSPRVYRCRKDPSGYWTVYNRLSGNKVRLSFDKPQGFDATSATVPELVDIKITDYCSHGCSFCYQGSTRDGAHADHRDIGNIAYSLGRMDVFEAAIGGGEPTMHPKFAGILRAFASAKVVPNFTTRRLDWMADPAVVSVVNDVVGGFAYSVRSSWEVGQLVSTMASSGIDASKAGVQYVMGSTDMRRFRDILITASAHGLRVTLLGFKTTGRGSAYTPEKYDGWLDVVDDVRKSSYVRLGTDTALAAESADGLQARGVSRKLYEVEEGRFSMYIDAVGDRLGPSSYCDASEMVDAPKGTGWRGTGAQWHHDAIRPVIEQIMARSAAEIALRVASR